VKIIFWGKSAEIDSARNLNTGYFSGIDEHGLIRPRRLIDEQTSKSDIHVVQNVLLTLLLWKTKIFAGWLFEYIHGTVSRGVY